MKVNSLRTGLNLLLSLISVVMLVYMSWNLFLSSELYDQTEIQLVRPMALATDNLNWRWFDQSTVTAAQVLSEQNEIDEQLAEASINAELIGVLSTSEFQTATIRINGQPEKVFAIGDELQPGVELVSVGTSRVVLNERGRRVQITMHKPWDMLVQLNAQNSRSGGGNAVNSTFLEDGFSLANMFDALPVQLEDSTTGIQLGGISEELLSLSTLLDGDVVMAVGGKSIDELMSDPSQWMSYTTETTLPVTVIREGEQATLYVNAFSLSARILPSLTSELMR